MQSKVKKKKILEENHLPQKSQIGKKAQKRQDEPKKKKERLEFVKWKIKKEKMAEKTRKE